MYLLHHFDPDVTQRRLKPTPGMKNKLHNLGYVQNVEEGQLLAEVISSEQARNADMHLIRKVSELPQGQNTHIDPENDKYLLSSKRGYVSYYDGKISVRTTLNVPSNVNFHTGNIIFSGDTAIQGNVQAGFEVHGDNILVKGMVEKGKVYANKALTIAGGSRGGAKKPCLLKAYEDLRVNFLEQSDAQAKGNIIIEKNCVHSTLYASRNVLIKERLVGGTIHGRQGVLINGDVGNSAATPTRIFLGYDPTHIRKLERIENHIAQLAHTIRHLTAVVGNLAPETNELSRKLARLRKKNDTFVEARNQLLLTLQFDEKNMQHCKIIILGKVFPGTEIAIGQAFMAIEDPCAQCSFTLANDEIICSPYTPQKKQ